MIVFQVKYACYQEALVKMSLEFSYHGEIQGKVTKKIVQWDRIKGSTIFP